MFEVGFSEIILILGLALLVLGPERLPELAAKVGRWTGRARAMARQFQAQLEQEVTIDSVTRSTRQQPSPEPTYPDPTPPQSTAAEPTAHEPIQATHSSTEPVATPAASPDTGSDPARQ